VKFQRIDADPGTPAPLLWLMLPGAYMKPADFIAAGFDRALREHGVAADVALLDAEIPQVADGSALAFLQQYLCAEATRYERVHLLGISLGAHLALACLARADRGPREAQAAARVQGACLLAPYLGPRDLVAEVAAAAPPFTWEPPSGAAEDIDRRIWHWLQRQGPDGRLHLGYGREDRFAPAHALMARSLLPECVNVQPGGHVWPVWTALWQQYLGEFHAHA